VQRTVANSFLLFVSFTDCTMSISVCVIIEMSCNKFAIRAHAAGSVLLRNIDSLSQSRLFRSSPDLTFSNGLLFSRTQTSMIIRRLSDATLWTVNDIITYTRRQPLTSLFSPVRHTVAFTSHLASTMF